MPVIRVTPHFKKQYEPIKFGDGPDPGTVEGHHNKMIEAAETRRYNRRMKELAAEDIQLMATLSGRTASKAPKWPFTLKAKLSLSERSSP
ncbi:MAG: hypothetical protein JWQ49_2068 [Edaphobacter sp.]|nr:hypothetical protein [Edaphobacter sp.]